MLAPTRELAIQIGESFAVYGRGLKLRQALVYGGVSQGSQVQSLRQGAQIVVATPGRLLDLMEQKYIKLDRLTAFVLDEADRMLDMGFLPDLKRIIRHLPTKRQSLFFSATLPPKIMELSRSLLTQPISVNVTPRKTSVERIQQRVIFIERRGKQALLMNLLDRTDVERTLVFTKTKRGANALAQQLERSGVRAVAIHGNKSQNARQRALEAFRGKQVLALVATDVAARGIDIDGVTHVVNFDMPNEPESYVHRIGRTGRAGADGVAVSFCSANERQDLAAIERLIGQKVPVAKTPEVKASPKASAMNESGSESRGKRKPSRAATGPKSKERSPRPARTAPASSLPSSDPAAKPARRRRRRGSSAARRVSQVG